MEMRWYERGSAGGGLEFSIGIHFPWLSRAIQVKKWLEKELSETRFFRVDFCTVFSSPLGEINHGPIILVEGAKKVENWRKQ